MEKTQVQMKEEMMRAFGHGSTVRGYVRRGMNDLMKAADANIRMFDYEIREMGPRDVYINDGVVYGLGKELRLALRLMHSMPTRVNTLVLYASVMNTKVDEEWLRHYFTETKSTAELLNRNRQRVKEVNYSEMIIDHLPEEWLRYASALIEIFDMELEPMNLKTPTFKGDASHHADKFIIRPVDQETLRKVRYIYDNIIARAELANMWNNESLKANGLTYQGQGWADRLLPHITGAVGKNLGKYLKGKTYSFLDGGIVGRMILEMNDPNIIIKVLKALDL